jgi:NlpC/P60 family putative phage cell wall peptidase
MRQQIITAARGWLGTPFHHEGRVKGAGVDCLQLLIAVYSEVGLLPPVEPEHYPWDWHFHRSEERYLQGVAQHARQVPAAEPGDIDLFKFGRCVSHAAIVLDWPRCIHAYFGQGVVEVDAVQGAELADRLHSFWSVIKTAEEIH